MKNKIAIGIFVFLSTFFIFLIIFFIVNQKDEDKNYNYEDIELNYNEMEKKVRKFIDYYSNYNAETLKNATWKKNILSFIETDIVSKDVESDLYMKLYNSEWQLTHLLNSNTQSKLETIDKIKKSDNRSVVIEVTELKNASQNTDSPYFASILTYKIRYLIVFGSDYKIHSVDIIDETSYGDYSTYGGA